MHDRILQATGGERGLLQPGVLDPAAQRCRWGPFLLGGALFERALLLLRAICQDHPFVDGNKRTAFEVADLFLRRNGVRIRTRREEAVPYMLAVAQGAFDLDEIAGWLRARLENV